MYRDPPDADRHLQRLAAIGRRLLRPQARVRRTGQSATTNAIASFGMIVGLLMVWAMAVNM